MKTISCSQAPAAIGPYSQAKLINGTLYISGQIPLDAEGNMTKGDIAAQTRQSVQNISAILKAAGYTIEDVVKTTCFLVEMDGFDVFNEEYSKVFVSKPARSCVSVKALPKGALVEIEAIASK